MLDPKKLGKFVQYFNKSLPKAICNLTDNLDMKIRKILIEQLDYIDLVTRDEFNTQTQHLFKIKEKLKQLETRLKILESISNTETKR